MSYHRKVTNEWRCNAYGCAANCSVIHVETYGAARYEAPPAPTNWTAVYVDDYFEHFCPEHAPALAKRSK